MIAAAEVWKKMKEIGGQWWDEYTRLLAESHERLAYGDLQGAFAATDVAVKVSQEMEKEPWAPILHAFDVLDIAALQSGIPHLEVLGAAGLAAERLMRIVSSPKAARLLDKLSKMYERSMTAIERFPNLNSDRRVLEKLDRLENAIELEAPEAEALVDDVATAFRRAEFYAKKDIKDVPLNESIEMHPVSAPRETVFEKRVRTAKEIIEGVEPEQIADVISADSMNAVRLLEPYQAYRAGRTRAQSVSSVNRTLHIKPVQHSWERFKRRLMAQTRHFVSPDVMEKAIGYMVDEWPDLPAQELEDVLLRKAKLYHKERLRSMMDNDPARFRQVFGRAFARALRDAYANISQ